METTKPCTRCTKVKPLVQFHRNRRMRLGATSWCKQCYREERPGGVQDRAFRLKRWYGLTEERYGEMWNQQKGKCAICKKKLKDGRGGTQVDHDHKTKKVRGLLCFPCNVALGLFREDEDRMKQAILYLRKHS